MKIHTQLLKFAQASESPTQRSQTETRALASARPDTASNVTLSPAARQLAALDTGDTAFDAERVHALRQALAHGSLDIDAERIADGLLRSALEQMRKN